MILLAYAGYRGSQVEVTERQSRLSRWAVASPWQPRGARKKVAADDGDTLRTASPMASPDGSRSG